MRVDSRQDTTVAILAFVSFIGIGLNAGLLGLAWPSIRKEFGLEQDAIGLLLIGQTAGYMTSSFFSGRLMIRLGTARAMLFGGLLMAAGLLVVSLAPVFLLLAVGGLVAGLGSGMIDAGMNNYVSSYYGARQMNWLHACFGVGWVLGSLVMTFVLARELPWRTGYAVIAGALLLLAAMFALTRHLWRNGLPQQGTHVDTPHASLGETLRLPMVWLSMLLIFTYTGIEASPNTWLYSIFTEIRKFSTETAGLWVTISLASFTLGRVVFGFIGDNVSRTLQIRACMAGTILGAVLLWWNPSEGVGFVGLLLLGFAQAPLFPLLILGTSDRVGPRHTANAIGMQISLAGAGIALVPAIGGVLAADHGLGILLPFFVALGVIAYVLHEIALLGRARSVMPEAIPSLD